MSKFKALRGTKDIHSDDIRYWQYIEKKAADLFETYNYQEIRTPIIEQTELFENGIGNTTDIVSKEMYTFTDRGKRRVTLRPEGTAPVVRALVEHKFDKKDNLPLKLFYNGPMFRYERPQAGRYRQFHQIGVEMIGEEDPSSDIEIISLAYRLFESLGLKNLTVSVNSIGDEMSRPVINEAIRQYLGNSNWLKKKVCPTCLSRFENNPLRILDCKNKNCNAYLNGLPDIKSLQSQACQDHFHAVVEGLESLSIPFKVNPFLVRGLDYYSRTTFEIISKDLGAQNAVCGGGRYDSLVARMGNTPLPAIGFAFGMERTVTLLKELNNVDIQTPPLAIIIPLGKAHQLTCVHLLDKCRQMNIRCVLAPSGKNNLKSSLKYANKINAKIALIYGEDEASSRTIVLKNLQKRTQSIIPLATASEKLKSELND